MGDGFTCTAVTVAGTCTTVTVTGLGTKEVINEWSPGPDQLTAHSRNIDGTYKLQSGGGTNDAVFKQQVSSGQPAFIWKGKKATQGWFIAPTPPKDAITWVLQYYLETAVDSTTVFPPTSIGGAPHGGSYDPKDMTVFKDAITCHTCKTIDRATGVCSKDPAADSKDPAAESVTTSMSLTGDGLYDWIDANKDKFKSAFTSDVARIMQIEAKHVTNVQFAQGSEADTSASLLADQTVSVTFDIAAAASTEFSGTELGEKLKTAINSDGEKMTALEDKSGITVKAEVTGVDDTASAAGAPANTGLGVAAIVGIGLASMCCLGAAIWYVSCRHPGKAVSDATPNPHSTSGPPLTDIHECEL